MEKTKIEWADHTFSPWIGCSEVHVGCENCYAAEKAGRFGVKWGPAGTRRRTARSTWAQVRRWDRKAGHAADQQRQFVRPKHRDQVPVHRPRVFPSLCDPFEHYLSQVAVEGMLAHLADVRRDLFALIDRCPNLDFLLLTKRPENVRWMWPDVAGAPYIAEAGTMNDFQRGYRENVWLLYSASDQETLEAGLPNLLACRDLVPVLGLSLEPLLGSVVLPAGDGGRGIGFDGAGLDWVIVGGESGTRARPCDVAWIRDIAEQCRAGGVPCFVKQLGANPFLYDPAVGQSIYIGPGSGGIGDPKGGDPDEWPEDLRVREWPSAGGSGKGI